MSSDAMLLLTMSLGATLYGALVCFAVYLIRLANKRDEENRIEYEAQLEELRRAGDNLRRTEARLWARVGMNYIDENRTHNWRKDGF